MTILEKIEEMNAARGWSTYELCKRANIAEGTLYSCKRRERNPSNDVLEKICRAYGITLYQFYHDMGGDSNFTEDQQIVLTKFSLLEDREKETVVNLIDLLLENKQKKV